MCGPLNDDCRSLHVVLGGLMRGALQRVTPRRLEAVNVSLVWYAIITYDIRYSMLEVRPV